MTCGIKVCSLSGWKIFLNILKLILKQMALGKPISNTTIVVELKAKRKYKTKNEKEDTTFKEFATLGKILVENDLLK